MECRMHCWSLTALLCCWLATAADLRNATDLTGLSEQDDSFYKEPAAEILASLLQTGVLEVEKAKAWGAVGKDSMLDSKSWSGVTKEKTGKKNVPKFLASTEAVTPSTDPDHQDTGNVYSESTTKSFEINTENKSSICISCTGDVYTNRKSPSRSLLSEHSNENAESVTSFVWPVGQGTIEFKKSFVKRDRPSTVESQEDSGSGDPHIKISSDQVTHSSSPETVWNLHSFMDIVTSNPSQMSTTRSSAMLSLSTEKAISPDSAEIDHLLQVSRETSVQSPSPSDGYEEVGIEDDDDDLEEAEESDDDLTSKDVRNFHKVNTMTPKTKATMVDEKPTSSQDHPFRGESYPKTHPEVNKDQTHTMAGTGENGTECRNGYVRRNNSCKSLCEIYPTYCYNGGQCYIVENIGAFCRCNTQDYIWHKGLRCESIITDFQVMCVAIGTAALVVLLLFMMTVFFAKKLYLLKTENYKLRKRNRYRTPSELHNDNFSLSTIAEGSHPNEDPNALQKVQDLPKACLKDEEPFNIQNSLSPKHDCSKGDPDIVDVNCVLNNLT